MFHMMLVLMAGAIVAFGLAVVIAILVAFAAGWLFLAAGVAASIVLACTGSDRRARGKALGWRIAVPIVCLVLGAILFGSAAVAVPALLMVG